MASRFDDGALTDDDSLSDDDYLSTYDDFSSNKEENRDQDIVYDDSSPMIDPGFLHTHQCNLVKELKLSDILPALKPFLSSGFKDEISAAESEHWKIFKLVSYIKREANGKQYKSMNSFVRILAATQPNLFEKYVKRSPTKAEINFSINGFVNKLKECIKAKNHCIDNKLDEAIDLGCEHIKLSIVKQTEDPKKHDEQLPHDYQDEMIKMHSVQTHTISVKNILNSSGVKSIIVFGRAGIGKTTTIQWLARQWAFNRWAPQFTLLVILQLRSLTVSDCPTTCLQLLKNNGLFIVTGEEKALLTASWLQNCADRILIMIDGLDEVSDFVTRLLGVRPITEIDDHALPLELCLNFLKGNLLKGCTLIATSRPFPGLKQQKFDSYLEILGLSPHGVLKYVSKRYKDDSDRIIGFLKQNPVLMSVCGITWYCMQISSILASGFVIDDTELLSYSRLSAFISVNLITRRRHDSGEFLNEVRPYFPQLAKLAYNGIFSKSGIAQVVFHNKDINKCGIFEEDLEKARRGGILQVRSTKVGRRTQHDAEFLHLSVQELLAMAYFLLGTNKSKENIDRIFGGGQFNMACMYMFGLCYDRKSVWIDDIRTGVNKDADDDADADDDRDCMKAFDQIVIQFLKNQCKKSTKIDLNLCQLVHEGKRAEHAKIVAKTVAANAKLEITATKMTAIDFMAVGFVVQYVRCLETIILKDVTADKTSLEFMSSSLMEKHRDTLVKLDISGNMFGDDGVGVIAKALCGTKSQLQILNVDNNNITYHGLKQLCTSLNSNHQLQSLLIKKNRLGDKGAEIISRYLTDNAQKSITTLDICNNMIEMKGAKNLGDALRKNECLKRLSISNNPIQESGVEAIADGIAYNTCLTGLFMNGVAWGSSVGKILGKMLILNQSLEDLYILSNNIGCAGATAIGASILSHPNLKRLHIGENNIGIAGAKGLGVGLKEANLELLNIGDNKLTWVGLRELSIALDGANINTFNMANNLSPIGAAGLFKNISGISMRD